MRSQLLQNLSSICLRNAATANSCKSALAPTEVFTAPFSTLTTCFSPGSVFSLLLPLGSDPYLTSHHRACLELVHQPAQLQTLKVSKPNYSQQRAQLFPGHLGSLVWHASLSSMRLFKQMS